MIRPYRASDRAAVRAICCRTAYRGLGSDAVIHEREIFADYWSRYYTDFEPDSCLVVEENGTIVGYLAGCVDTRRHIRVMASRIVPGIIIRFSLHALRGREPHIGALAAWVARRAWREAPPVPLDRYPAHYHCNLVSDARGKAYYSDLALRFLDRIEAMGVAALHGRIEEPATGGVWRRIIHAYGRPDLIEYEAERPSTFYRDVLGDPTPMMNRVWGIALPVYRDWLIWAGRRLRM